MFPALANERSPARSLKTEQSGSCKWQPSRATKKHQRRGAIVVSGKQLEKLIERIGLLVVDENPYTRKLTRMMLMNIGAKSIFEAADGLAASSELSIPTSC
jgi:hypothetical protein